MDEGSRLLAIIGDIEMMRKTQPVGKMPSIIENLFSVTVSGWFQLLPLPSPVSSSLLRYTPLTVHPQPSLSPTPCPLLSPPTLPASQAPELLHKSIPT